MCSYRGACFGTSTPTSVALPLAEARQRTVHDSSSLGRKLGAIVLLGGSLVSCSNSTNPVFNVYAAIVYGVVTDASGAPAPNVVIESDVYRPTCTGGEHTGSGSPTIAITDAAGRYYHQILSGDSSFAQCVRVNVRLVDGSMHVAAKVTGLALKLRSQASLPYDSVRADIVLP